MTQPIIQENVVAVQQEPAQAANTSQTGLDDSPEAKAARRKARIAALMPSQGMWKGQPDKPQDSIAYQKAIRSEWR